MFKSIRILIILLFVFLITAGLFTYKNIQRRKYLSNIVNSEFKSDFSYDKTYTYGGGANPIKVLVLGNSISSGVLASDSSKDYIHVLMPKISNLFYGKRKVIVRVHNIANFESGYENFDFSAMNPLLKYNPEIVIFQLGENYRFENNKLFTQRYTYLANMFGEAKLRIVLAPYWSNADRNNIATKVALNSKSFKVDISNLFNYEPETRADFHKKFKNKSLGEHPGDYGMQKIAEEIFICINAFYNNK